MAAAHLRRLISEHPRFDLIGLTDTAVATLFMVQAQKPAVVLIADESPGLQGRDVLAEMAEQSPNSLVIITTPGEPEALAGRPGVAQAVSQSDVDAILAALNSLADFLDDPGTFSIAERRGNDDRRRHQNWSKVFAERRTPSPTPTRTARGTPELTTNALTRPRHPRSRRRCPRCDRRRDLRAIRRAGRRPEDPVCGPSGLAS